MPHNILLSPIKIIPQPPYRNEGLVKPCPVPVDQFDVKRAQAWRRISNKERMRSTRALHRELQELVRIFDDLQETRDRDAVYLYLRAVYWFVMRWKCRKKTRRLVRGIQEFAVEKVDRDAEAFATVIRCTTNVDAKTRSKWSRVLRFVEQYNRKRQPFKEFIKERGGINECASRFARYLGRRQAH
jgi:hypothetical protein